MFSLSTLIEAVTAPATAEIAAESIAATVTLPVGISLLESMVARTLLESMVASVVELTKLPEPEPAPARASGPPSADSDPETAKVLALISPMNSAVTVILSACTEAPRSVARVTAVISLRAAAAPAAMAPRSPPFSATASAPEPASAFILLALMAMISMSPETVRGRSISAIVEAVIKLTEPEPAPPKESLPPFATAAEPAIVKASIIALLDAVTVTLSTVAITTSVTVAETVWVISLTATEAPTAPVATPSLVETASAAPPESAAITELSCALSVRSPAVLIVLSASIPVFCVGRLVLASTVEVISLTVNAPPTAKLPSDFLDDATATAPPIATTSMVVLDIAVIVTSPNAVIFTLSI